MADQIWDITEEVWNTDEYTWDWFEAVLPSFSAALDSGAIKRRKANSDLKNLSKKDEEKLITILTTINNKKYKQTKKIRKKTVITVEDIQFLIKETKGIEIKILKD